MMMERMELGTGRGRIWRETVPRLSSPASVDAGGKPDLWLYNGHDGDLGQRGPAVAVVYEAGWGIPELDADRPRELLELIDAGTRAGVQRADAIITGASSAKHEITRAYGYPAERIHVVPFGVDLETFHPERRSQLDGQLVDPSGSTRPYILFVNSLEPRKNVEVVRGAVARLVDQGYPHRLVLVASPARDRPDSSELTRRAFAQLPGHPDLVVHLEGLSEDLLASVMAGCSAFCAPSRHEGFGLTVLEAMASGAPVVVSNRGALPEVVAEGAWWSSPAWTRSTKPCAASSTRRSWAGPWDRQRAVEPRSSSGTTRPVVGSRSLAPWRSGAASGS
jgi:glycosyltransferase involved in cell wall biosynthesis